MAAGPGKALAEGGDARLQSGVGSRLGASIFSPTPILIPLLLLLCLPLTPLLGSLLALQGP